MSHNLNEPQWPPRSPYEALMSSPSGRRKFREQHRDGRISPTPSPSRRALTSPSSLQKSRQHPISLASALNDENEDEEDEETLQLQLQAIEARLKLRRLRQAKLKAQGSIDEEQKKTDDTSIPLGQEDGGGAQTEISHGISREGKLRNADSQRDVQIPLSPPPKRQRQEEVKSPKRILLGIDKGLTGRDVSLRRAPSVRDGQPASETRTPRFLRPSSFSQEDKPKSFSERIAQSRLAEKTQKERDERIRKSRSRGFGVDEKEMESFKTNPQSFESPRPSGSGMEPGLDSNHQREFSRDEVLQALKESTEGLSRRTHSGSALQAGSRDIYRPSSKTQAATPSRAATAPQTTPSASSSAAPGRSSQSALLLHNNTTKDTSLSSAADISSDFESFSSLHLSKRILPHAFLARTLSGKKTFSLPDLLRTVKAPEYDLPDDVEGDFVVFALVASKSEPRSHKSGSNKSGSERSKYMVLTLTDLKWELELFLFGTGFERWWKLSPGTVLAILNPGIMPPPPNKRDTGKFSLTLNSSDDTVLEIGTARDLGFCKSVKKDGKECGQWIDKRRTEFCEFHINIQFQKTKAGRMEVNTMSAPFAPGGKSAPNTGFYAGGSSGSGGRARQRGNSAGGSFKDDGLKKEGPLFDRETRSRVFITPSVHHPGMSNGRTTASLLDDEDVDPDAFHRGVGRDERLRRRLAQHQRERDLVKKLGEAGDGIGGEYMRVQASGSSSKAGRRAGTADEQDADGSDPVVDASALGLVKSSTRDVKLSPVKRKRTDASSFSSGSSRPMGWSHAFKRGIAGREAASFSSGSGLGSAEGEEERGGAAARGRSNIAHQQAAPITATPAPHSASTINTKHTDHDPISLSSLDSSSTPTPAVGSNKIPKMTGDTPSPRKKTRFVTADGIKEAGADSLGVQGGSRLAAAAVAAVAATRKGILRGNSKLEAGRPKGNAGNFDDDDDDDDLLII